jgi:hypothetical protein
MIKSATDLLNGILSETGTINEVKHTIRPLNDKNVLEKLKLNKEEKIFNTIKDFLFEVSQEDISAHLEMEKIIPLMDSLNPYKKPNPYKDYFVTHNENHKKLKHIEDLEKLLEKKRGERIALIERATESGGILLIGEKGSGKTLSQNYWLYENNSKLEKERVFWVRLDATKLYDLWNELPDLNNANITTTKDYFYGQLAYVFCKYFRRDFDRYSKLFYQIANELSQSNENQINLVIQSKKELYATNSYIHTLSNRANSLGINNIYDLLLYMEKVSAIDENTYASDNKRKYPKDNLVKYTKSYLIESLKDSQKYSKTQGMKPLWVALGELLKDYITRHDYYILYIVDGLDNLNFYFKHKKPYLEYVYKFLYDFPLHNDGLSNQELVLLSIRDTTFVELKRHLFLNAYPDSSKLRKISNFYQITVDKINVAGPILNKRVSFYLKRHSKYSKSKYAEILNYINSNNIIVDESRWNGNIRCNLFNHATLAKYLVFRLNYFFGNNKDKFNIKYEIEAFENINFLLNGELYYDSETLPLTSNEGNAVYNILGYNSKSGTKLYLIYARIIQAIVYKETIKYEDLMNLLTIFKYNELDIRDCIDKLVSNGLIKSFYSPNSILRISYQITTKGKYMLKMFFSNIHFIYYSFLDIYLPLDIFNKLKIVPNNYQHIKASKRYYPPFCISNAFLALRFLKTVHNVETKEFNMEEKSIFTFPIDNEEFIISLNQMIEASLKDDDYKFELTNWFTEINS